MLKLFSDARELKISEEQFEEQLFDGTISEIESIRIKKFVKFIDRKRSYIGRLLLRHSCVSLLGLRNDQINFKRTKNDKPILLGSSLGCNISHDGNLIALFARKCENISVGVDLACVKLPHFSNSVDEFIEEMSTAFSNKEKEQIRSAKNESKRLDRFYRVWSLKESYLKAIGTGLQDSLHKISFEINWISLESNSLKEQRNSIKMYHRNKLNHVWCFESQRIENNYIVSVCYQKEFINPKVDKSSFQKISIDSLINSLNN
ncbi:l-aminoadipate-semialdehyde dehydrogenase-phosphopantetheinyl transferase [Anaeramoeba flamelloides]|uniref:holo-[acyl-carrier-protein] synthase n=1 Tax=Anaeramoeba flamelloides TaxID=1746091 RepID=A0AAV7YHT1_9EUKA|nr:l-aminoadipate-semialdehyde dehydrogenase-phosphopantetheinyl transferase [Anaeramoeba flamelloides]KAJ6253165.1 l-aminoadipate-semialdehyde dehydrogenase-phosphopantetheinyl transferase [Anaeramoeba flamelloides]